MSANTHTHTLNYLQYRSLEKTSNVHAHKMFLIHKIDGNQQMKEQKSKMKKKTYIYSKQFIAYLCIFLKSSLH